MSWDMLQYRLPGTSGYFVFSILSILSILSMFVFQFARRIYRLYFHPLKRFRGLPEACISDQWLYKTTKTGAAEQILEDLHQRYNTKALRIGPNELHLTDINLYKVIYSQSKPFLKYASFYDGFNTPHTVFAETNPEMHKERRRLLSPLFSKMGTYKLEPVIREKIFLLCSKIDRILESKPIDTYNAFRLMTTDIITQFAFSKSANLLEEKDDDFDSWFLDAFDFGSESLAETQYKPLLRFAARTLPVSLIKALSPDIGGILDISEFAEKCLREWQVNSHTSSHPVVFDSLQSVPDEYKVSEAMDILIAGADTTASTLTTGIYHILSNPEIEKRLVEAIDNVMPEARSLVALQTLEQVEYLIACMKESLRMGMAVPGRLPRLVPNGDPFIAEGKIVPPGTVVSMSTYTMHTSTDAWGPDARNFNPERWIGPAGKGLDQWLCTFSKGARMCLGQNIAPAEITLAFAYLFRNFKLALPVDHVAPKAIDRFTLQYRSPGLPILFKRRSA